MPNILDYYEFAKLATAGYVQLEDEPSLAGDRIAFRANLQERIPLKLAEQLFDPSKTATPWTIPTNGYLGNQPSGFAATLFQRNRESVTEKVLAIRGTEPSGNLIEDLLTADLAGTGMLGLALTQVVDLVNWFNRISTGTDAQTDQLRLHASTAVPAVPHVRAPGKIPGQFVYFHFSTERVTGLGLIDSGEQVIVTGHSLGGHLAALAARLFPSQVSRAYTYNAPGFDPDSVSVSTAIPGVGLVTDTALIGALGAAIGPGALFLGGGSHRLAEPFLALLDRYLGFGAADSFAEVADRIYTLESENIAPGDDASAVAGVLTGAQHLPPETFIATERNSHLVEPLMDSLAMHALLYRLNDSLSLARIHRLYLAGSGQIGDTLEKLTGALHKAIIGTTPNLPVVDIDEAAKLWSLDAGNIDGRRRYYEALLAVEARVIAARQGGSPLRVELLDGLSFDAIKTLAAQAGDADGSDDLLITNTVTVRRFVSGQLGITLEGAPAPAPPPQTELDLRGDLAPVDHDPEEPGVQTALDALGNLIVNPSLVEAREDVLYGGAGSDRLRGLNEVDRLEGRAGEDQLEGGADTDILRGQAGEDTLYAGEQFDWNALQSYAEFGGANASGLKGEWLGGGLDKDRLAGGADDDVLMGGGGQDVLLGGAGDDLLDGDRELAPVGTGWTLSARPNPHDYQLDGIAPGDYADALDVGAADLPFGGVGNDRLHGGQGDDLLMGEDGADILTGDGGADILIGGAGDDRLSGEDNYVLRPDARFVAGNDYLDGGAGDDELVGQGGADDLFGGEGHDQLFGDDDTIEGNKRQNPNYSGVTSKGKRIRRGVGRFDRHRRLRTCTWPSKYRPDTARTHCAPIAPPKRITGMGLAATLMVVTLLATQTTNALAREKTVGEQFRAVMKQIDARCKKEKLGPYLDPKDPQHREKQRYTECDILKLKPVDPLATEEGRFAHSLKLPPPHDQPKQVYKPGMTGERYFKALCEAEAGEWVFRTVDGVEGVMALRPPMPTPSSRLSTYLVAQMPVGEPLANMTNPEYHLVLPDHGRYSFLESIDDRTGDKRLDERQLIRYVRDRSLRSDIRPYGIVKTEARQRLSRYGYTYRAVTRENSLEQGILGGELVLLDLDSNEVIGFKRAFYRLFFDSAYRTSKELFSTKCHNVHTRSGFEFIVEVLKPSGQEFPGSEK